MRLQEYLAPGSSEEVDAISSWGGRLTDNTVDWYNLSIEEKIKGLAEVGMQVSSDFFTTGAAGLNGLARLAETGSIDEAVSMINHTIDGGVSYQIQSEGGAVANETMMLSSEPAEYMARSLGDAAFSATGSPAAGAAGYTMAGILVPGKGKGKGKHKNKKIRDLDGRLIDRPKKMTDVPDIRGIDVDKATSIAEYEPHLIPSGASGEGAYVGGPRDIKNRRQLIKQRGILDDTIARGAPGGDWYDRYRVDVTDVTGGSERDNLWMTSQEGQYSAGVDPGSEVGFALKDNNSAIAYGNPVKPARPAQQSASIRAIANNDPSEFMLGEKTGEYARRVNPASGSETSATGVNDFRHARNLGYTEVTGEPQRGGLGSSAHRFMDHETALAVSRANESRLGGRDNWTGEQVQAAPWVMQKADDLYDRGEKSYLKKARNIIEKEGRNESPDVIARELAFNDANRTIGDFYGKHTAFATHEAQPYVDAGHLPRLADASPEEKRDFAGRLDSKWDNAPGGRDAIYAGTRLGDTGYAVRTRPTTDMQGMYTPPDGSMEFNPGQVARPLVAFNAETTIPTSLGFDIKNKVKEIPAADRSILDAGESVRSYIDAQGSGAWHKPWLGGQKGKSNSLSIGREVGPASPEEMVRMQDIGGKYGLGDVIDTGEGFTMTNFEGTSQKKPKEWKGILSELDAELSGVTVDRAKIDSNYIPMFEAGSGNGQATRRMLKTMDSVPEGTRRAMDNNPDIPKNALARMERDESLAAKYGATREDIQNARRIIGEGPGWIDRLKKALESGAVLPALAMVAFGLSPDDEEQF